MLQDMIRDGEKKSMKKVKSSQNDSSGEILKTKEDLHLDGSTFDAINMV